MELTPIEGEAYRVDYTSETHTLRMEGSLRLSGAADYQPIAQFFEAVVESEPATLVLDLRELQFLNSSGISMLSKFAIGIRKKPGMEIIVKGSATIPWQGKSLKNLQKLLPSLQLEFE